MARLVWDATGEKKFESGVDHAVYYPLTEQGEYTPGVAWNGIISIAETPEGAEPESQYADNIKYLTMISAEELNGTIEAYTYPDEFAQSNGEATLVDGVTIGQQTRRPFGICYRSKIGNDVGGQDAAYKLHMIYGMTCSPSERAYETRNDSPEAITLSWDFSTTPVNVTDHQPSASVTIDSSKIDKEALARLENVLYGEDAEGESTARLPRLPLPDEIAAILSGDTSRAMTARMTGRVRTRAN